MLFEIPFYFAPIRPVPVAYQSEGATRCVKCAETKGKAVESADRKPVYRGSGEWCAGCDAIIPG